MEKFVPVSASVHSKSLNTQAVTKQELPKCQAEHLPTYQIDTPKNETNKKLFAKADSLVDKLFYCPRIKLSISQTLISDDSKNSHSSKIADVPGIYFNSIHAAGISRTLAHDQISKPKTEMQLTYFQNLKMRSCKT